MQFEKFVVDSKFMSSQIIKRGGGRNGMFGKTQSDFSMIALKLRFYLLIFFNRYRFEMFDSEGDTERKNRVDKIYTTW